MQEAAALFVKHRQWLVHDWKQVNCVELIVKDYITAFPSKAQQSF